MSQKVLPTGWENPQPLSEIANVIVSSVDKKNKDSQQTVKLCNYMDVYSNAEITSELSFMESTASAEEINKFSLQKGDVIITKDSETPDDIGIPAYVAEDIENLVCGYHLTILRPLQQKMNGRYLSYALNAMGSKQQFKKFANGSTRFGLTAEAYRKVKVPVPSISEQLQIGNVLKSVDQAIDTTRQVIEQTRQVKRALMQELLTRGLPGQHTRFKQTPLGELPEDWKVVHLKDILREPIRNGYSPNCPEEETGSWILGLGAVTFDGYSPLGRKPAPMADERVLDFILEPEDLLVSRSNTRERVGLAGIYNGIPENCSYPDLLMRVRINKELALSHWVEKWLLSPLGRRYFEREARGTSSSMVKIDRNLLERFLLCLPSITEQKEILYVINAVEEKICREIERRNQLSELKSSLMQVLLTGEKRVVVAEQQNELLEVAV